MSPRPGPARPLIAIRLSEGGIKAIDEAASARGVNRSEMIRLMLAYAQKRMPAGWSPS